MSMRYYGFEDYGIVLDDATILAVANAIAKEEKFETFSEDDFSEAKYFLEDRDIGWAGEFQGEFYLITEDGRDIYADCEYREGWIHYIRLSKWPTLFKPAFKDMNELVADVRQSDLGKYLPEDFDIRANLRHICGTTWG